MSHLIEAFLIVSQPRQRLTHWSQVLAALDTSHAPPLAKVVAYYDPNTDEALLGLFFDPIALGSDGLTYVMNVALLAEIGMVQPAALTEADRRRFHNDRLSRCTLQIDNQRSVIASLAEIVRIVRDARAPSGTAAEMSRSTLIGRLPMQRSPGMPPIPMSARGTRDDLKQISIAKTSRGTRDEVAIPPPHPLPPPPRAGSQGEFDADTERRVLVAPRVRTRDRVSTAPYVPPVAATAPQPDRSGTIYGRYLRSGRWVAIRIGALSLKGATLLTGALPRSRDHVDVALAFGVHRALVRGTVGKLSSIDEAQASGVASFSIDFELDDASKRQLTALLTAARAANITIKPPPPRAARRFPVEWPICLGTTRGAIRGHALDVSMDGMFVRPGSALALDTSLSFSAVLDDGEAPISGRARVVRHISDAAARTAGLTPGYGLHIIDMAEADRRRWLAFVARIEKRAEKRVLIGASPARLSELQAALAALGYAVTGGTDPGALVQLANGEARPVDAALIDASWLAPSTSSTWVESLFSARDVPCLTLHGDPRGARQAVDKLLSVT